MPHLSSESSTLEPIDFAKSALTLEVLDLEDRCPRLCSCALKLWRVDLDESLRMQVIAETLSDSSLELENRLVRLCLSKIMSE